MRRALKSPCGPYPRSTASIPLTQIFATIFRAIWTLWKEFLQAPSPPYLTHRLNTFSAFRLTAGRAQFETITCYWCLNEISVRCGAHFGRALIASAGQIAKLLADGVSVAATDGP